MLTRSPLTTAAEAAPFVTDLRAPDDPSLGPVPRLSDFATLQSYFNLDVRRDLGADRAKPGEEYFRLAGFYIRSGIAAYIPKVLDENGNPLGGILVFRHWPGADPLPQPPNPFYFDRGVGGFTNADGDIGFGYAGGSVVLEDGGPDAIWCSADPPGGERMHSDCAVRLGWYGSTDHLTANPIFQVTTKAGEQPPPGGGETSDHYITVGIDGQEVWRGNFSVESFLFFDLPEPFAPAFAFNTLAAPELVPEKPGKELWGLLKKELQRRAA